MSSKRKSSSLAPQKKRKVIDLDQKINIVRMYDRGQSLSDIARLLNMAVSTINTIVKDRDRIEEAVKGSASMKSTIITKARSGIFSEMEKLLTVWMEECIQNRFPLSSSIIQGKALSIFEDLKEKTNDDNYTFTASNGWFNRFKKRSGFHNVRVYGEAASADSDAAAKFTETLKHLMEEEHYIPQQIFNLDETGLFWKKMPGRSNISKNEKSIPGFKAANDRMTLLLGGNLAGYKLKPFLVYCSENPLVFTGIDKESWPLHFRSNSKAWITLSLFEDWFVNCFIPETETYCKQQKVAHKILLLIDNAPNHPTHLSDINANIKVVFMPPNTTSLIQPMEQGVIRAFKAYYVRSTFLKAIEETDGNKMTLIQFWKSFDIRKSVYLVSNAWDKVTESCMIGVWRKVLPQFSASFNDFDKEQHLRELTDEIVTSAQTLGMEVEQEDIEQLIDGMDQELTTEDLIELEAQIFGQSKDTEYIEIEGDISVLPQKEFKLKEMSLAFKKVQEAMSIFEEMDHDESRFLKVKRSVQHALSAYKEIFDDKKNNLKQLKKESVTKPAYVNLELLDENTDAEQPSSSN